MPAPSILLDNLGFDWPSGARALAGLTAVFGPGRTGLIGANGSGKSTLLRLIVGKLQPTRGTITTIGDVDYLPQNLTLRTTDRVVDLLGVRSRLEALRAIEAGRVDPELFDSVGDDWDIEARARAVLDQIGLDGIGLDRPIGQLSGGETMLAALAGHRLGGAPIVLLDEPTNNLDREARGRFAEAVQEWRGALVVVSHDTELLEVMDDTAELYAGELTVFGGPFSAYREHLMREQEAAEQALRTAEQTLRAEERQRREAEVKLARRQRYARTDYLNKRRPKIIMNTRKSQAENSAGKLRDGLDARVDTARADVEARERRVRNEAGVRIDLPDPRVPAGRRLAEVHHADGVEVIQGPERIALTGRNGVGKTRLLETLFGAEVRGDAYAVGLTSRIGYLPQRLDGLVDAETVLENVRAAAPRVVPGTIRGQLARFGLRGAEVDRPVGSMSGGERFRVAIARLLLADPAHQLLVLDEPTNNLDFDTRAALVDALGSYRGGLLVVSHDPEFLGEIGIDVWLEMTEPDRLSPASPLSPG
ncbi:ABC-F family ATP-binding cassette domain-containing protein [Ammonicoccus fulvus]|uniref:ABC-F family ATP-binding cassette domain-containing protein n=1 Tax=Ammonicoccus fulvus TaxID=3138240 RepID=A0ABZ3FWD0_9ACTN